MPTLNELFRPFRAGADATAANPELDPERLAGAEAGLEYAGGPWRLSTTGFVNRLSHAIANVTLGQGPGTFPQVGFVAAGGSFRQRQNVDAVSVRGIEVSAEWARGPWSLRAAMSLSRLWRQQNKKAEARQMLTEIYHWFTEGFDTKDLQEAKALLDILASSVKKMENRKPLAPNT